MLILSRAPGERIIIGDGITLTVLSIDRNRVRLGFTGDPAISIKRQEVLDRAAERAQEAACPVAGEWRDEGGGG